MTKNAILFGSIGTLVETSELQRQSFNRAFQEAGVDWEWRPEEYRRLLTRSGGLQRVANYARDRGEDVDAQAIHARKTEIFDREMIEQGLSLRDGVSDVIAQAKKNGTRLGFVTTTSRKNVNAIFKALGNQVHSEDFEFIGDASMVSSGKPGPEIYLLTLKKLGLNAADCVAIEDTAVSAKAAQAAGIETYGFPGEYADRESFGDAVPILDPINYQSLMRSG